MLCVSMPVQALQGSQHTHTREISRHRPHHAVRFRGPARLYRSRWDLSLFAPSPWCKQPKAYLSVGGSTDTGSLSFVRAPLSRCPADMPLLAVKLELAGHPEDSLSNL